MNNTDIDPVSAKPPVSSPFVGVESDDGVATGEPEVQREEPEVLGGEQGQEEEPDCRVCEVESSRAIVLQARHRWFAPEQGEPLGMATGEQLDLFRELRTRLLSVALARGLNHFTILVAPLACGSGASFVARNLAAALTLHEERVTVLIDCNLRNPTQHLALRAQPRDLGLFEFLEEPATTLDRLVVPTVIPRLHLIPAGRPSLAAREYFSSFGMNMLMDALRQELCCAVLDGPPVQGAPDARILSELADMVVLVVGYGRSSSEEISEAAAAFDRNKFAGVVFNELG